MFQNQVSTQNKRTAFLAIPTGSAAIHGISLASTIPIGVELERRGWNVIMCKSDEPDFLRNLVNVGQFKENLIFLGLFFYDFRLRCSFEWNSLPLSNFVKAPIYGVVGDHPFASFMGERISMCDPESILLLIDPDMTTSLNILDCPTRKWDYVTNYVMSSQSKSIPFSERTIDLLLPFSFHSGMPGLDLIISKCADGVIKKITEEFYFELLNNSKIYPLIIFSKILKKTTGFTLIDYKTNNKAAFNFFMQIVSAVDYAVRSEKRKNFLAKLSNQGHFKKIIVTDSRPQNCSYENIDFVGNKSFKEILEMMANAKYVGNVNASFPNSIHERVLNAMAKGCVVITDSNPIMQKTFKDGVDIIFWDTVSNICELACKHSPYECNQISLQAKNLVFRDFGADKFVNILEKHANK